jgi:hypothetical protein
VNYATAVTLTFFREAFGAPMTQASELYARLLASPEAPLSWSGARLRFASIAKPDLPSEMMHGVLVEAVRPSA